MAKELANYAVGLDVFPGIGTSYPGWEEAGRELPPMI